MKARAIALMMAALLAPGAALSEAVFDPYPRGPSEVEVSDAVRDKLNGVYYTVEPLLGGTCLTPRPPEEVYERLSGLAKDFPDEPGLALEKARALYAMSRFDDAEKAFREYAAANPVDGSEWLAKFYAERLMPERELEALASLFDALAEDPQKNKDALAALIVRVTDTAARHLIKADEISLRKKYVDLFPNDPEAALSYLDARLADADKKTLLAEIDVYAARFPADEPAFLALKARLYRLHDEPDKANNVFTDRLDKDSSDQMYAAYFSLLQQWNELDGLARQLESGNTLNDDQNAMLVQLHVFRQEHAEAGKALRRWIGLVASPGAGELDRFARYADLAEQRELSARLLYACLLIEPEGAQKRDRLYRLFMALIQSRGRAIPATGNLEAAYSPTLLDPRPGISGGFLSLLINGAAPGRTLAHMAEMHGRHQNFALAYQVRELYREEAPDGKDNPLIDIAVMERLREISAWRILVKEGEAFAKAYPRHPLLAEVLAGNGYARFELGQPKEAMADFDRALVLAFPEEEKYLEVLDRYVSLLLDRNLMGEVMAVYWREIEAHPERQSVYERFLRTVSRLSADLDQKRLYELAAANIGGADWNARLARWYLKNRAKTEFMEVVEQAIARLPEDEISRFLLDSISGSGNYDYHKLKAELFKAAHRRHPRRVEFVGHYLDAESYLQRDNYCKSAECELELADMCKHALMDNHRLSGNIGNLLLDKMSGVLDEALQKTDNRGAANLYLRALILDRLSRYETAEQPWAALVRRYPATPYFHQSHAERLLGLHQVRPADFPDGFATARAEIEAMASMYPARREFTVKLGEMMMEKNDHLAAGSYFAELIAMAPGVDDSYLSAAELCWDYFLFDEAAGHILKGRERLSRPGLYALELGSIYEDTGKIEQAVGEYVNGLVENEGSSWAIVERLVYLSGRRGVEDAVRKAFEDSIAASPGQAAPVWAYVSYLDAREDRERLGRVLAEAAASARDLEFLERALSDAEYYRQWEAKEKALLRLVELSADKISRRLALVGFYIERDRRPEALALAREVRKEISGLPGPKEVDYLAALSDLLWLAKDTTAAKESMRKAISLAPQERKKELSHRFADNLIKSEEFQEAASVLDPLIDPRKHDQELFAKLSRIYNLDKNSSALIDLNRQAAETIKATASDVKTRRAMLSDIHVITARALTKTGKPAEAVDYYIEWINQNPVDLARLREAWIFAAEHDIQNRLAEYYDRAADEADKDYRWSLAKARIAFWQKDTDKAIAAYRSAIRNEPGKTVLYRELVPLIVENKDYGEAARMLKAQAEVELDGSHALQEAAFMYFLADDQKNALATLDFMVKQGNPTLAFPAARVCAKAGKPELGMPYLERGFAFLLEKPAERSLDNASLQTYVEVMAQAGKLRPAAARLGEARKSMLEASNKDNGRFASWRIKSNLDNLDQALTYHLAGQILARGFLADLQSADGLAIIDGFGLKPGGRRQFAQILGLPELVVANTANNGEAWERSFWMERMAFDQLLAKFPATSEGVAALAWQGTDDQLLAALLQGPPRGDWQSTYWRERLDLAVRLENAAALAGLLDDGAQVVEEANHFLEAGRPDLAERSVISARPANWSVAKRLLIKIYAADYAEGFAAEVADILRAWPVSERLARPLDRNSQLVTHEQAIYMVEFARYLHLAGDHRQARDFRYAALEDMPRKMEPHRATGQMMFALGEHEIAEAMFLKALELEPGDLPSAYGLALARQASGDESEAVAALHQMAGDTASRGAPVSRKLYQFHAALDAGYAEEAVNWLESYIVSAYKSNDEELKTKGWAGLQAMAWQACLENPGAPPSRFVRLVERLVSEAGNIDVAQAAIANGWIPLDRRAFLYEAIIDYYSKSGQESSAAVWRNNRLLYRLEIGAFEDVIGELNSRQTGLDLSEIPEDQIMARAKALIGKGDAKEARDLIEGWLGVVGRADERMDRVARFYAGEGLADQARSIADRKFSVKLRDPMAGESDFTAYANFLFKSGEPEKAARALEEMVARRPAQPAARILAADMLDGAGQFETALRLREEARVLDPDHAANRRALVMEFFRAARPADAGREAALMLASTRFSRNDKWELLAALIASPVEPEAARVALEAFRKVASDYPQLTRLGESALAHRAGLEEAGSMAVDALAMRPALGGEIASDLFLAMGRPREAEEAARRTIFSFPQNPRARPLLAEALSRQGEDMKALAALFTGGNLIDARQANRLGSGRKPINYLSANLELERKLTLTRLLVKTLSNAGAYSSVEETIESLLDWLSPGIVETASCASCLAGDWRDQPCPAPALGEYEIEFLDALKSASKQREQRQTWERDLLRILPRLDNGLEWSRLDPRLSDPRRAYQDKTGKEAE